MEIKKKIYLTLIIFSFLIILISVFIIFPLISRIKDSSQKLIEEKEKFLELEAEISDLEKFKNLSYETEELLKQVDFLFVDSKVPLEFISFFEQISEKTGIEAEIQLLSDKKIEKTPWPYLIFKITLTSSFPDFLKFLDKIENSSYLIEMENITVSKLTDDVRYSFSFKVFVK